MAFNLFSGSMGNRGRMLAELAPIPNMKKNLVIKEKQVREIHSKIQQLRKVKERYCDLLLCCLQKISF